MTGINLSDGKYTVVNELEEGGGFKALRYGEEWRDLTGDNLVLVMYREIEELREQVAEVDRLRNGIDEAIYNYSNEDYTDPNVVERIFDGLRNLINGGDSE